MFEHGKWHVPRRKKNASETEEYLPGQQKQTNKKDASNRRGETKKYNEDKEGRFFFFSCCA
jgi:hypothetical protein